MKLLFRILLPLSILGVSVWMAYYFISTKPEPQNFSPPPQVTSVEATRMKARNFQIYLESRGTVRPRTTTTLIPEVSGRIVKISPNFREGGFFEKNEVLLSIDPLDYQTAKTIAESSAAQAEVALREEEVRGQQAADNWKRLGKSGNPSDMVLRKPQLAEAKARLAAARAEVAKAERDLERTEIHAPFEGRILEHLVDVGQYVTPGTQLGRAFATDVMEVHLPLTGRQLAFIDLPDNFQSARNQGNVPGAEVLIKGGIGAASGEWAGRIVRADSAIDEASRQLFVVAEINDPYRRHQKPTMENSSSSLKIGMFVDALVKGKDLKNVFVLPRKAVRIGGDVILIGPDNRIRRKEITPIWSNRDEVVVSADEESVLKEGDVLCLTPIAYPTNGALVHPTIDGETLSTEFPGQKPEMRKGTPDGRRRPARPGAENPTTPPGKRS